MIDKDQIKTAIGKEIDKAIKTRFKLNGGQINLNDVINEAGICLATNYIILQNKLPEAISPDSILSPFLEGVFQKVEEFFPNNFNQKHKNLIYERFKELKGKINLKDIINIHYNNLYGSSGGNVL